MNKAEVFVAQFKKGLQSIPSAQLDAAKIHSFEKQSNIEGQYIKYDEKTGEVSANVQGETHTEKIVNINSDGAITGLVQPEPPATPVAANTDGNNEAGDATSQAGATDTATQGEGATTETTNEGNGADATQGGTGATATTQGEGATTEESNKTEVTSESNGADATQGQGGNNETASAEGNNTATTDANTTTQSDVATNESNVANATQGGTVTTADSGDSQPAGKGEGEE